MRRKFNFFFRRATSKYRKLPDVLIIGTQKGGTTTLYNHLIQHKNINGVCIPYGVLDKEVHYFSLHSNNSINWYKAHFPLITQNSISIEATPYYLFHPLAASRIKKLMPEVKLIVMLRNPVERAISHYKHNLRAQREWLSLPEAITRERAIIPYLEDKIIKTGLPSVDHGYYSYLSRGLYKGQIERYLELFERSQILFLKSEDYYSSPQKELDKVYSFLGLPKIRNQTGAVYNKSDFEITIDPEINTFMSEYFIKPNEGLENLVGFNV